MNASPWRKKKRLYSGKRAQLRLKARIFAASGKASRRSSRDVLYEKSMAVDGIKNVCAFSLIVFVHRLCRPRPIR